jgi:hypothetical protein
MASSGMEDHMEYGEWAHGPFGPDAGRGRTLRYRRTVLVIVHTVTAGTRLGDVVPMLEADPRIQVVFTHPESALIGAGTRQFLGRLDGVVLPWRQATQIRFDLALTASDGLLEWVRAPVVSMLHGVGYTKYPVRWDGNGPKVPRTAAGPERVRLVSHGRLISSALLLPTEDQVSRLLRSCPEAAPIVVIAGDPCYDRLAASLPSRERYRQALGTGDRTLVAVSSTWGSGSLLERRPRLIAELVQQLPPNLYQVAAIVHPGVWYWHGVRQVRAWYSDLIRAGLVLVPPEEGWRAVLAAADVVVGDHGSVTCYAAAVGLPVVLGSFPAAEVEPGSQIDRLAKAAPKLRPGRPYAAQLAEAASAWSPQRHAAVRAFVTDIPGESALVVRSLLYRLMKLPEPQADPVVPPVPLPRPVTLPTTFGGDM